MATWNATKADKSGDEWNVESKDRPQEPELATSHCSLVTESGFTLLEVLVAVAVVGMALVMLLRLHLLSLDATLAAQDLTTAVLLAEGKMATFMAQPPRQGEDQGRFDGPDLERFSWTTSVIDYDLDLGGQNGGEEESIGIRHVTVSVHWREGNRDRSYSLETYESK